MAHTISLRADNWFGAFVATQIADLRARRARNRVFRQTLRELQSLSNRELSDLGMSRGNLRAIAYEAAYMV